MFSQDRWQDLRRSSDGQDAAQEAERAAQARGHHQANGDLDRVQGMFPHDTLHLYDENPLAMVSGIPSPFGGKQIPQGERL